MMKNAHLIPLAAALCALSSAEAYDIFPGMIKPTAASPNGQYLVTKAPFAPHVVWQMPEGKPVFIAGVLNYNIGEKPVSNGNHPLPPVITNDGWLITSSDSGQDDFGETLVQATNIHNGAVQTFTDRRSCEVFGHVGGVTLMCFSELENWQNRGGNWQKTAMQVLPDYTFGLSSTAGNDHLIFGVEYSEGEFDAATEAEIAKNFGIQAFNATTLEPEFTVPLKCCLAPTFVAASGRDHFLWAESVDDDSGSGGEGYREPVTLHQLSGDHVTNIGQLTLAAYPYGIDDNGYRPQLSPTGRYLSGVFQTARGKQYIYDIAQKSFLAGTPFQRGLWLNEGLYASRADDKDAAAVTVQTFPTPANDAPRQHLLFHDLDALIRRGMALTAQPYPNVDYQPHELANGVIARNLQELIGLIEDPESFSLLAGKIKQQFPVADHAVWLDIDRPDQGVARYLAYRVGNGKTARWVLVARLTP